MENGLPQPPLPQGKWALHTDVFRFNNKLPLLVARTKCPLVLALEALISPYFRWEGLKKKGYFPHFFSKLFFFWKN